MGIAALVLMATLSTEMIAVDGGEYRPLYLKKDSELYQVDGFLLDDLPVSNLEYYQFTQSSEAWKKENVPALFAEVSYLAHWPKTDTGWKPLPEQNEQAVVNVSWFAAQAFCNAQGKRLPTVAEWEYVALASESQPDGSQEAGYRQRILDWYVKSTPEGERGQSPANYWGIKDLHGLIWEWTEDFNSTLTSGESRADSSVNTDLYCAAGTVGAADPGDYAAFMRYGFRSSLQAVFTIGNLGFRCAKDISVDS